MRAMVHPNASQWVMGRACDDGDGGIFDCCGCPDAGADDFDGGGCACRCGVGCACGCGCTGGLDTDCDVREDDDGDSIRI